MPKYEVVIYVPNMIKMIIEAESKSKATYKAFKSQLGETLIKNAKFTDFIKYIHDYTKEV